MVKSVMTAADVVVLFEIEKEQLLCQDGDLGP